MFRSIHRIVFVSTNRRFLSMCTLYMSYLCIGGIIFALMEKKAVYDAPLNKYLTSSFLIRKMVEVLRKNNFSDDEIAASFAKEHYEWRRNPKEFLVSWTDIYGEKVLFCMVLIATTGYGNVVPTSTWGRIAVMIYLVVGRPIQITMMRLLGLQFRSGLRKTLKITEKINLKYLPEFFHHSKLVLYLAGTMFYLFFTVIFIFGPAAIFETFENWTFNEGLYFAVLSLSTIGLGDYVAGVATKYNETYLFNIYVALIFFWLLFGVAFVQMTMTLMSYLYGLLVLDKLDCKCRKRENARQKLSDLYNITAELNWKLTKYCPDEFGNERFFQEFLNLCVDHPEKITEETMQELYEVTEELRIIASNKLRQLELPDDMKSISSLILPAKTSQKDMSEDDIVKSLKERKSAVPFRGLGRIYFNPSEEIKPPIEKLEQDEISDLETFSNKSVISGSVTDEDLKPETDDQQESMSEESVDSTER